MPMDTCINIKYLTHLYLTINTTELASVISFNDQPQIKRKGHTDHLQVCLNYPTKF